MTYPPNHPPTRPAIRPLTPDALLDELAGAIHARAVLAGGAVRVLLDGAAAARPDRWADGLVERLQARSRAVLRVSAWDFLRPASLRLERGRTDPDAFYDDWLDAGALVREVLAPAAVGSPVLPRLWDVDTDRAVRAARVELAPGAVVLVDGPLLLGRGLPADLEIHVWLSAAALARHTPEPDAWTLPAYGRYAEEVDPASFADLVVLADHPDRPALQVRP
jgi:hypothetical protein